MIGQEIARSHRGSAATLVTTNCCGSRSICWTPSDCRIILNTMSEQIIYSMVRVKRIYPPNKEVIRDISLSFFYGAKIGVLGLNGAGKSTLLRIMAGQDEDYLGETMRSPGYTVGLLEQEPRLETNK